MRERVRKLVRVRACVTATACRYIELGKALRNYENDKHAAWRSMSEDLALELLKLPVLRVDDAGDMLVNFPPGLLELIREAKCLDKMGFSVGETVMNIALREQQYITLQVTSCTKLGMNREGNGH